MIKKIIFTIMFFSFFSNLSADYHKLAYDFNFKGLDGNQINLKDYDNKIIVVVNVASRCGYTPQYNDLQKLYTEYKNELVVIGVPTNNFKQEPKNNAEIKQFCKARRPTRGVKFKAKIIVLASTLAKCPCKVF